MSGKLTHTPAHGGVQLPPAEGGTQSAAIIDDGTAAFNCSAANSRRASGVQPRPTARASAIGSPAAFATPIAVCGRGTKAALPMSASLPATMLDLVMSKIARPKGRGSAANMLARGPAGGHVRPPAIPRRLRSNTARGKREQLAFGARHRLAERLAARACGSRRSGRTAPPIQRRGTAVREERPPDDIACVTRTPIIRQHRTADGQADSVRTDHEVRADALAVPEFNSRTAAVLTYRDGARSE